MPSLSLLTALADNLIPKCSSCGTTLQNKDSTKPGFFIQPSSKPKAKKPTDAKYEQLVAGLLPEDRALLMGVLETPTLENKKVLEKSERDQKIQCIRCRSAHHKGQFNLPEFKMESPETIMELIPPASKIVYVISATDFPMSLNDEVFKYVPAKSMLFVVTKNDLLFQKNDLAIKYGERFFQDYMERTYKVPRANVFTVSGQNDWNIYKLIDKLQDGLYFIGAVNSGKSTLIQSLINAAKELKLKQPNSRREREMQKRADEAIARGGKAPGRMALLRQSIRDINKFKEENGPGVSYMPGFTRGTIPFQLSRNVTVRDVPGFSNTQNNHLHEIIDPPNIKLLLKGKKLHKAGMYTSHYETVKPGQTATVGGLFFLETSPEIGSFFQIRNCLNFDLQIFKNMEKARNTFYNSQDPAIRKKFIVSEKTDLVKYVIPSFYGVVDIVFRYLGHITITPTGAKTEDAPPLVIYLPRGIEAIMRQPITNYVTTTLAGRDAKGNPLRKEKWVKQSVKEVKRYTGKTPFYSRLIPIEEESDPKEAMLESVQAINGPVEQLVGENNKYAHWVQ